MAISFLDLAKEAADYHAEFQRSWTRLVYGPLSMSILSGGSAALLPFPISLIFTAFGCLFLHQSLAIIRDKNKSHKSWLSKRQEMLDLHHKHSK